MDTMTSKGPLKKIDIASIRRMVEQGERRKKIEKALRSVEENVEKLLDLIEELENEGAKS